MYLSIVKTGPKGERLLQPALEAARREEIGSETFMHVDPYDTDPPMLLLCVNSSQHKSGIKGQAYLRRQRLRHGTPQGHTRPQRCMGTPRSMHMS